jgi:hypothetical protein
MANEISETLNPSPKTEGKLIVVEVFHADVINRREARRAITNSGWRNREMKKKDDTAIRVARITRFQAIAVALIPIIPTVFGTLFLGTDKFSPQRALGTAVAAQSVPAVLDAPHLYFRSDKTDLSLESCMEKAGSAVSNAKLTGKQSGAFIAWGHLDDATGVIWCNTDYRMITFLAAGKNYDTATKAVEALHRSFLF